jgi:peptidyl-Lys metalloendopeptidase
MRAFLVAAALASAEAGLIGKFEALPKANEADVLVDFTITNDGEAVTLQPYQTAVEGIVANIFQVTNVLTGEEVPYVGMEARFVVDNTTGFVLELGDVLKSSIDLSMDYAFPEPNLYAVVWRYAQDASPFYVRVTEAFGDRRFGSLGVFRPTPLNCNAQQTSDINTCHNQGVNQQTRGLNYLRGSATPLFTLWFGTGSRSTVTNCFTNIGSRINSGYRMQCNQAGCPSNTYAYVYPSDTTFTVYLCSVFWSRPTERAETLIHELSHFNSVCRTNDWAYGRSACQNLARTNPARAIDNADNICYFGADA